MKEMKSINFKELPPRVQQALNQGANNPGMVVVPDNSTESTVAGHDKPGSKMPLIVFLLCSLALIFFFLWLD